MSSKEKYIAAFDLDKTILSVNSSRLVVKAARENGYMDNRAFWQAIYFSILYKFDLKDPNKIVISMMQWLKGINEKKIRELISVNVVPGMLERIRPEIRNEVHEHRTKGARVILLSSALPYLCDPVAESLEMDDVVCSSLEVIEGKFTGKARRRLVFGREKAVRMKEYCQQNSFDLSPAWYYGDAFTDRFVMKIVGNPVAVKPEIRLGRLAKRHGWKVI